MHLHSVPLGMRCSALKRSIPQMHSWLFVAVSVHKHSQLFLNHFLEMWMVRAAEVWFGFIMAILSWFWEKNQGNGDNIR